MTASEPMKFTDEEMQAIEQVWQLVEDATRGMTVVQRQAFLNVALGIEFDVPLYGPDHVARRPVPPLPPKRGGGFSTAKGGQDGKQ